MMYRDPYRHYRRAMRGYRRGRRHDYPVLLIEPGQPLGWLAFSALCRWVYRHRSAFLPFIITVAAFVVAAMLHRHHPAAWIAVTILTVLVTVILGIPRRLARAPVAARILIYLWEACGIGRPIERAYGTVVIATTGGWLAAAIAVGPLVMPLPRIAVIATVILGIPWWTHRRRRARVRALRTIQSWPGLAENMGLPGSRIASIVTDKWGWTGRVILRKGTTAVQAINQLSAIESGLGIRPGSARAIPDSSRADRLILRVVERDPHAEPIPWTEPTIATVTRPIVIGLFEDGRPVAVLILRRNVLLGGTTGAGKSGVVNVILAALVSCHDAEVWGIDLKGGMELQPWARCLAHLATTPQDASELLAAAVAELDRRATAMATQQKRLWEPTATDPAIVIIIDEYAELPADALDHADSIARRGRAVAVNLLAATQKPTQDAMGGNAVRSQMDVRLCLRVRERRDTDLILGQGAYAAGWHAHALSQPGTFLLSDPEHTTPERARAYLITDDQITHSPRRPMRHGARQWRRSRPRTRPAAPGRRSTHSRNGSAVRADWRALGRAAPGRPGWRASQRAARHYRHDPAHPVPASSRARPGRPRHADGTRKVARHHAGRTATRTSRPAPMATSGRSPTVTEADSPDVSCLARACARRTTSPSRDKTTRQPRIVTNRRPAVADHER